MRRSLEIIIFVAVALSSLSSQKAIAQCPTVYDFYGMPSSSPYWYSCSGFNFSFNLQSPSNWGAYTVDWGDGTAISSGAAWNSPQIINHVYSAVVDTFAVTITETATGCVVNGVVVMEKASSASIQIPVGGLTQACAPQTMEFINSSTNVSETTVFTWDFGDGSPPLVFDYTNWLQTISHTYEVGTVDCETEVSLVAQNYCNIVQGGPSTATFNPIRIWDLDDPGITASATLLCYPDTTVTFINTTERNCYFQGNIYQRYELWNFGDYWNLGYDSIIDWTPWPPTFPHTMSYPGVGTYQVQLLDSNFCGIAQTAITIQIVPPPVAGISAAPDTVCLGESITFFQQATGDANSYSWNFGNGLGWLPTGSGNITYMFNTPGTYTVQSRVAIDGSSSGCADTASVQVVVLPIPTVALTADQIHGCDSLLVDYTQTSSGANSWQWTFDVAPNNYSGTDPPLINYSIPGNYQTEVTVTSPNGCSASDDTNVHVHPSPIPSFTVFNLCEGDTARFTDTTPSEGGDNSIIGWNWDFGDGFTSTNENPDHLFNGTGDFIITLEVATQQCTGSYTGTITVDPAPIAEAGVDQTQGCAPLTVQFSNASAGAASYLWNFGDGTTSTLDAPQYTFYNASSVDSIYMIVLHAFNAFGCGSTDTLYITVLPGAIAAFDNSANAPGCSPFAATFVNQSQNASGYLWNFGDGTTSSALNPSHLYSNTTGFLQTFTAQLIAYQGNGCNDTITQPVIVYPLADFGFDLSPAEGCAPLTVTMPYIAGVQSYSWNFGDGSTAVTAVPTHTFQNNTLSPVQYTVTLVGISPFGCADTSSSVISVNPSPLAQFTSNVTNGCSPLSVTLQNLSASADNYTWDYGDGQMSSDNSPTHTHVFVNNTPTVQTYNILLTAQSNDGCASQFSFPVQVFPAASVAVTDPGPQCSPATVFFFTQGSAEATYNWDFGNGIQATGANPSAYYINNSIDPITFNVSVSAISPNGCSADTSLQVLVNPRPDANFTLSSPTACSPAPMVITNNSTLAASYTWNYGDGTFSTNSSLNHTHVFQTQGINLENYVITLTAISSAGCIDTMSTGFTLFPGVQAEYTVDTTGCSPYPAAFINQSVGATSYEWNFGDASFSSLVNPNHTYSISNSNDAVFQSLLIVTNQFGCSDTAQQDIYVYHSPIAIAQLDTIVGCYPLIATFYNGSIGADSYEWVYGTGITDTTSAQMHSYTYYNYTSQLINYPITLNAFTVNGCQSSDELSINVSPEITADFNVDTEGCTPLTVYFDNTSNDALSYYWNFGDGDASNDNEPMHTFFNWSSSDTTYLVTLVAFNQYGCSDTTQTPIQVFPLPQVSFTANPQTQVWPASTVDVLNTTVGGALNFSWDMGDGTQIYTPSPGAYSYGTWGEYTIRLIANNSSCSDTAFQTVNIIPPPPVANFIGPAEGCVPLMVQFTNLSDFAVSSHWLFGDGGEANATNPFYTYWTPGTYTVTLIVDGYDGSTDQMVQEQIIQVYPRAQAAFIVTPNEVNVPSEPVYSMNISQNATSYEWNFGDGSTSNQENPIFYYTEEGIYSVTLIANNQFNCPDTMIVVDAVYATQGGMISFPNAFTPNTSGGSGGGYDPLGYDNDVFFPMHAGVDEYALQIFNKWGELLYESKDVNKGWDGYYRGVLCKQDVYVWKVRARFVNGQQYVQAGDVTLLVK